MQNLFENKYFKFFLYVIPLLLNLTLIFFISKSLGDNFININDSAIFFTEVEAGKKFFTLWTENNLGFVNSIVTGLNFFPQLYSLILLKLNLSIKQIELIIYFVVFTSIFYSSWYGFYLIQKKFFKEKSNIFFPFLVAFFYSYNIFQISHIDVIVQVFLLEITLPFLLYILLTLIYEKIKLKHILALSLIIALTINIPMFSVAVFLCLFASFIFFKRDYINFKFIKSGFLVFIISLLLAAPLIYSLIHAFTTPDPYSSLQYNQTGNTSYIFPPYGIMSVFQFFFHWTIVSIRTYSNSYFRSIYGLISSYLIWGAIFALLIAYWKKINNKRLYLFLISSLLIGIFFLKGGQKPFSDLNMFIYDSFPPFVIFRTPGTKFGLPIVLIISTIVLFLLNVNKKKFFLMVIIVSIFAQTWIFFKPINFIGETTFWWNKPVVKISENYYSLISFLNGNEKSGAVLFYPGLSSNHYDLKNGVKFSFQDVLGKYIKRPVVYPDHGLQLSLAKKNIVKIIDTFNPELIGNSSIRYVIIRKDFDANRTNENKNVQKALIKLKTSNFRIVYNSNLFTVFEINNEYYRDIITIRTSEKEYTPIYKRITPYHYVIDTKIKDLLGKEIIFRNNFHPQWKILDLEKKGLKAKQDLTNNFANGWKIEPLNEKIQLDLEKNIELDLYFYPQKILFTLSILSFISLGAISTICMFLINKKITHEE